MFSPSADLTQSTLPLQSAPGFARSEEFALTGGFVDPSDEM
jgi:hypothetical protein